MSLAFSSMGRFPRQVMRNVFSRRIFLITAIKYIIASVVISVILDKSKKIESWTLQFLIVQTVLSKKATVSAEFWKRLKMSGGVRVWVCLFPRCCRTREGVYTTPCRIALFFLRAIRPFRLCLRRTIFLLREIWNCRFRSFLFDIILKSPHFFFIFFIILAQSVKKCKHDTSVW